MQKTQEMRKGMFKKKEIGILYKHFISQAIAVLLVPVSLPIIKTKYIWLYEMMLNALQKVDVHMNNMYDSLSVIVSRFHETEAIWFIRVVVDTILLIVGLVQKFISKIYIGGFGRLIMKVNGHFNVNTQVNIINATTINLLLVIILSYLSFIVSIHLGLWISSIADKKIGFSKKSTLDNVILGITYISMFLMLFPTTLTMFLTVIPLEIILSAIRRKNYSTLSNTDTGVDIVSTKFSADDARIQNTEDKDLSTENLDGIMDMDDFIGREKEVQLVKDHVQKMLLYKSKSRKTTSDNSPQLRQDLLKIPPFHMIITGNPGTGKTEFARSIGKYLYEMGVTKKGRVVEISRHNLSSIYVAGALNNLNKYIDEAKGGVLFIDEAYSIIGDSLDTNNDMLSSILKIAEDKNSEIIMIFAGYKDEMTKFLNENKGLARRFHMKMHFEDYPAVILYEIFLDYVKKEGFDITEDAKIAVMNKIKLIEKSKTYDFGNAAAMKELLDKDILNNLYKNRNKRQNKKLITLEDIWSENEIEFLDNSKTADDIMSELNSLIGLTNVKEYIMRIYNDMKLKVLRAESTSSIVESSSYHCIFTGNPGTGKTTVARLMGKMFRELGIIKTGHVVEVTRADLVGAYIGQTEQKVKAIMEQARGGILFVDEAYQLYVEGSSNDFGRQALQTIMTDMENNRFNYIVVFAGYKDKIENMISNCNIGFTSRFKHTIHFPDYTNKELEDIFIKLCKDRKMVLTEEAQAMLPEKISLLKKQKSFANARSVRNYYEEVVSNLNARLSDILDTEGKEKVIKIINEIETEDL